MSERIKLVAGDTKPAVVCTLTDDQTGLPLNIAGATPRLYFRAQGSSTLLDTLVGVVTDGANGVCRFDWNPASLNQPAGPYEGEVEITFADATKQTVFETIKFNLRADFG